MNRLFKFRYLIVLLALSLFFQNAAWGEHYYGGMGPMQLTICDSIVVIKFKPGVPEAASETFAQSIAGLNENYLPEREFRKFYVYHVDEGFSIDTLINNLFSSPEVLFCLPCLL